ncbi:Transcriptional antiterminator [Alkalibacterium subtropicum]|uniref:Transcriptional antiterminator n=1 Tax=Alkalibacterium subtropicum TaxID=753702 RepID=A0A1I1FNP4_9LACT|nr:PTS sugar transporter subunit IIA [Alkalibacterium subtropicum]SFC00944.1 Transcriptional antiterminator [Alkalibacterium subtropicum]
MLTFREIDIIVDLLKNPYRTVDSLASKFGVSERTVRYDLETIGDVLHEQGLVASPYDFSEQIDETTKKAIGAFLEDLSVDEVLLQSKERYLLMKATFILMGKLNLTHFSKKLGVTRVTVKNDYDHLLKELPQLYLDSVLKHKQGFVLMGTEKNIRDAQWKILNGISEETIHNKLLFGSLLDRYMNDLDVKGVSQYLSGIQDKLGCVFSDETYRTIRNYLIVCLLRNKKGAVNDTSASFDSYELEVLKSEKKILENYYGVGISEGDLIETAKRVISGKYIKLTDMSYHYWVEMDKSVYQLIRTFSDLYGVDLTKDKELFEGLSNHIKPILFNIRNNIEISQPVDYDVQSEYPDVYDCTLRALKQSDLLPTERKIDEEVALITIHFAVALNRGILSEKKPKNVLVVCSQGIAVSKLLKQRLEREFSVRVIDTIPLHYLSGFPDKQAVDLVITTIDLQEVKTDLPVLRVNTMLTDEDIRLLEKAGIMKTTKKIELSQLVSTIDSNVEVGNNKELIKALKEKFGSFILDDLISAEKESSSQLPRTHLQIIDEVENWEEAVRAATDPLVKHDYVAESYREKVIESFEKYGYYMFVGNDVAIPHARANEDVYKTGFSILILRKKVAYSKDNDIKVLISFASADNLEHLDTLVDLMDLVKSEAFMQALDEDQTEDELYQLISSEI